MANYADRDPPEEGVAPVSGDATDLGLVHPGTGRKRPAGASGPPAKKARSKADKSAAAFLAAVTRRRNKEEKKRREAEEPIKIPSNHNMSSPVDSGNDPDQLECQDSFSTPGISQDSDSSRTMVEPSLYDTSTTPSESSEDNMSTAARSNSRTRKSNVWTLARTKVSMLPIEAPTPGYSYMSPTDLAVPISENTLLRSFQRLVYRVNAYLTKKTQSHNTLPENYHYYDSAGRTVPFTITHDIGLDEVDHPVCTAYDWTEDWDWVLTAGFREEVGRDWQVFVHIYLNDMPDLLCKAVPRKDQRRLAPGLPSKCDKYEDGSQVKFPWRRLWRFSEPVDNPCWGASIDISYRKYTSLAHVENPWSCIELDALNGAEINQRTGVGRFKKVLWFHEWLGYGNDIIGQPVEGWKDTHKRELISFIGRLMPISV